MSPPCAIRVVCIVLQHAAVALGCRWTKASEGNLSCARASLQRFWSSWAGRPPARRRQPAGGPRRWTRRRRRDSPASRSSACTRSIPITSVTRWTATPMRVLRMGSPRRSMAASTGTRPCTATGCWCAWCVCFQMRRLPRWRGRNSPAVFTPQNIAGEVAYLQRARSRVLRAALRACVAAQIVGGAAQLE